MTNVNYQVIQLQPELPPPNYHHIIYHHHHGVHYRHLQWRPNGQRMEWNEGSTPATTTISRPCPSQTYFAFEILVLYEPGIPTADPKIFPEAHLIMPRQSWKHYHDDGTQRRLLKSHCDDDDNVGWWWRRTLTSRYVFIITFTTIFLN